MDALVHLIANIPDWSKKLDELNSQIEQRQHELAKIEEETKSKHSGAPKSIRNKGSTESLRPRDEPEAHPDPVPQADGDNVDGAEQAAAAGAAAAKADADQPHVTPSSPTDSHSPSALARQENQMRAAGQARARATLRKRQRTDSMLSSENPKPKYRSRTMIIVYYDSYVQSFFEELVKFVSASRNMMRKAKMAAKVEQMRRQAEMEPDDTDSDDKEKPADPAPPASTSAPEATPATAAPPHPHPPRCRPFIPRPTPPRPHRRTRPGLEYVQSMCEHAAHQFLRDGECAEEVANIKSRLGETKEQADKEMERIKREDPDALKRLAEDTAAGVRGGVFARRV
ncbi:hypothetical protein N0V88_005026 [Collariella sp. IMI 366227]|nr:hypothetical protein N0V88_005026 [Collariella sp. IMI 366227]